MKSGDVFEFLDGTRIRSESEYSFYDQSLWSWIPVGANMFVCLARVKNVEWKDSEWDHSLFFTDGSCLFHMRVNAMIGNVPYVRSWGVSFTRIIK